MLIETTNYRKKSDKKIAKKTSKRPPARTKRTRNTEVKYSKASKTPKKKAQLQKKHGRRGSQTNKNLQNTNNNQNEWFGAKQTIKQSAKPLQKIRQTSKYIYNPKMQDSKQMRQQIIVQ